MRLRNYNVDWGNFLFFFFTLSSGPVLYTRAVAELSNTLFQSCSSGGGDNDIIEISLLRRENEIGLLDGN